MQDWADFLFMNSLYVQSGVAGENMGRDGVENTAGKRKLKRLFHGVSGFSEA